MDASVEAGGGCVSIMSESSMARARKLAEDAFVNTRTRKEVHVKESLDARSAQGMREIAALAICDPKTVARYLDGDRVQSTSRLRIQRAMMQLGLVARPAQKRVAR